MFDAIIIGSGIGGLTAGSILSKLNKKKVLILEKHFEIGGLTHIFSRGRYKWEVGVHYVGRMNKDMIQRIIFDYITDKRIKWLSIVNPFERFMYKDFSFGVSASAKKFKKDLIERFPSDKKQLLHYLRDINSVSNWFVRHYLAGFLPKPLSLLLKLINFFTKKVALITTAEYMKQHISNQNLAAILSSQWGDYGTPPDESAFVIHATIVKHFINGGFFPEGGSQRISTTIENVIEQNGGMILVNREVKEILTRDNRVMGVRVMDNRFDTQQEQVFYAPVVISNVGAELTYTKLVNLPSTQPLKKYVQSLEKGYSAVTLYIGLTESPETLNVKGENYWINTQNHVPTMKEITHGLLSGNPKTCYVSFPSLRSNKECHHIAVVISIVDYSMFKKWKEQDWRFRDSSYYNFKDEIAQSLIRLTEKNIPGFSKLIDYYEVSTPLSIEHFTNRGKGAMYGFKQTPKFFSKKVINVKSPVKGLYLSGTDACSAGVTGAMMGGVAAASVLNGPFGFFKIIMAARMDRNKLIHPSSPPSPKYIHSHYSPISDKVYAKLLKKTQLTDTIIEFCYKLPKNINFNPGQYARIQYGDAVYGSYSIVGEKNRMIRFIIDTKFGGVYAHYFKSISLGDYSTIRLPLGDFTIRQSNNKKVFISTGTGIAPQIAMIHYTAKKSYDTEIDVYFGCRYIKDNFIKRYLKEIPQDVSLNSTICISNEKKDGFIHGRVTKPIHAFVSDSDIEKHDYYVSGNPLMVAETINILRKKGALNIYSENY